MTAVFSRSQLQSNIYVVDVTKFADLAIYENVETYMMKIDDLYAEKLIASIAVMNEISS